jgi:hypothetical protein
VSNGFGPPLPDDEPLGWMGPPGLTVPPVLLVPLLEVPSPELVPTWLPDEELTPLDPGLPPPVLPPAPPPSTSTISMLPPQPLGEA